MNHIVSALGPWEYYCRKVAIGTPSTCWEWKASCGSPGYGNWHYSIHGLPKAGAAHRRTFMLFNGYIDTSVVVCHRCNNRRCCNPDHLYAGTHATNAADKIKHGTALAPPLHTGSKQWNSRLTEEQVLLIKRRLRSGEIPPHIAPDYGVCAGTIYRIRDGSNWGWLQP